MTNEELKKRCNKLWELHKSESRIIKLLEKEVALLEKQNMVLETRLDTIRKVVSE